MLKQINIGSFAWEGVSNSRNLTSKAHRNGVSYHAVLIHPEGTNHHVLQVSDLVHDTQAIFQVIPFPYLEHAMGAADVVLSVKGFTPERS
jgi:hypothetical protein